MLFKIRVSPIPAPIIFKVYLVTFGITSQNAMVHLLNILE